MLASVGGRERGRPDGRGGVCRGHGFSPSTETGCLPRVLGGVRGQNPPARRWVELATTYQSENFEPSRAVPSAPLWMSYTPGCAVGLLGSSSDITVCQVVSDFVMGSFGMARM